MIKKIGIIASGGEWSGLPTVRELGKLGFKIYLFTKERNSSICFSKYVNGGLYKIPNDNSNLVNLVLSICIRKGIEYLIFLDEEIKYKFLKGKNLMGNIKFALPSQKSYEIAFKKHKSTKFAEKIGIPVPKTIRVNNIDDLIDMRSSFTYPLVIKGERGDSSSHVRYAHNFEQLKKYFVEVFELEKQIESASSPPMIQEYIGGPTYLTQALSQNGNVKIVIPHYKFREWPITGGVSSRAKTIVEPRLVKYMKMMLESLDWHGEAGMEWKYDSKRDDFFFMEMNPRFEGSLDLAIKSGANLPSLLVDVMDNDEIPNNLIYNDSVHYRWFFRYDFRCFLNKKFGIFTLLMESFNPKIHGEIPIDEIVLLRYFWKNPIYDIINFIRRSD